MIGSNYHLIDSFLSFSIFLGGCYKLMFLFDGQSRPLAVWHSQVRWIRGLEMEADFWRGKLSLNPEENVSLERVSD